MMCFSPKALDCCGSYPQLWRWGLLKSEFSMETRRLVEAELFGRAGNDPSSPKPSAADFSG